MSTTLARQRWYRLIPIAFITYSLAYLDRANFGFAAAGGMARDLNITACDLLFARIVVFSWIFLFSDSRCLVCC